MADYIVHKAVEVSKCHKAVREYLSQPGYLEENYISQAKYDGCNMVAVVNGPSVTFLSRTGELVQSVPHIGMALATLPGAVDGVYLGECWAPDLPFAEISGLFRRKTASEETCRLQFVIFDYLTLEEWNIGSSLIPYDLRVARMPTTLTAIPQQINPIWLAQSWGRIKDTWPNGTAQQVANQLVEVGGYDGLICRDPKGRWFRGDRGTNGEIIKVKPLIRVTCEVVDYELGKGKHAGRIGTLVVVYNGKRQGAGTGLKDSERGFEEFGTNWKGKLVEIEALGLTEDGYLREPRLKGVRDDVLEAD